MLHTVAGGIYPQENEEEDGEAPQGGTAVTEERQRDADDGGEPQYHTHVDEDVEQEDAHDAIPVDTPEAEGLALSQMYETENEDQKENQH